MTECVNIIRNISVTAYGASICCITLFCAGRSSNYFIVFVTRCGNSFLCFENCITYRAMRTLCKSCVCTVGSNSRVNNYRMTECVNIICNIRIAANGASICCIAFFCASGIRYNCIIFMSESINVVRNIWIAANGAGVCCIAFFCASRFCDYFVVTMSRCGHGFLCFENFITYRAMRTLCKSCVCTIRSNSRVNNYRMTECVNVVRNIWIAAYRAGICCVTFFCASRFCDYFVVTVSRCGHGFLCFENFVTYRAMRTLCKTCMCTVGSNSRVNNYRMTESVNIIRNIRIAAYGAGVCCVAFFSASRFSYNCIIFMTESVNIIRNIRITANGASICCVAFFCASRFCNWFFIAVVFSRKNLLFLKYITANRAMCTLRKSCMCAVRNNGGVNNYRVSCCGNCFLCFENFVTYRAMRTLCKSCVRAVGSNCRVNNYRMTECVNIICFVCFAALWASVSCVALFRAGGSSYRTGAGGNVALGYKIVFIRISAVRAGVGCVTLVLAAWRRNNSGIAVDKLICFCVKIIILLLKIKSVGVRYPNLTAYSCKVCGWAEVIKIISYLSETSAAYAVIKIIIFFACVIETFLCYFFYQFTRRIKMVKVIAVAACRLYCLESRGMCSVGIEIIFISVNSCPCVLIIVGAVIIECYSAWRTFRPYTADEFSFFGECIVFREYIPFTRFCFVIGQTVWVKPVIWIVNILPSCWNFSGDEVSPTVVKFIKAGVFAVCNAVVAKVVVVIVYKLHTLDRNAVYIIWIAVPAVFDDFIERKSVCKTRINRVKFYTLTVAVIRVNILILSQRILFGGIICTCAYRYHWIWKRTRKSEPNRIVAVECCAVFKLCSYSREYTDGVNIGRFHHAVYHQRVNIIGVPLKGERQSIGRWIYFNVFFVKSEHFAAERKIAHIQNFKILIKFECYGYVWFGVDFVCKLQESTPNLTAEVFSECVPKRLELIGQLQLAHIHSKIIMDYNIFVWVSDEVAGVIIGCCVCDFSVPCNFIVFAHRVFKVKSSFGWFMKIYFCLYNTWAFFIPCKHSIKVGFSYAAAFLRSNVVHALNISVKLRVILKWFNITCKSDKVVTVYCRQSTVGVCHQRKGSARTVENRHWSFGKE